MKQRKIRVKYKLLIFVIDEGVGYDNLLSIPIQTVVPDRSVNMVQIQKTEFVAKSSL